MFLVYAQPKSEIVNILCVCGGEGDYMGDEYIFLNMTIQVYMKV